jgi:molecular chaperone DnaK (HSP70)
MRDSARFVVGIDLGTTNSAVAYVDLREAVTPPALPSVHMLSLEQLVAPGEVAARPLLPSFLYLAGKSEFPAGALDVPWAKGQPFAVGELARGHGWQVPMRLVSSAKSWLSHAGVDRTAAILPPQPPGAEPVDVERVSPVEATTRYLVHLREAWNHAMAKGDEALRLEQQDVYLTVPASFDAVARELTVRAAAAAGLEATLLEEPQAAFYSWLGAQGEGWRKQLSVGDVILVCDIGGGTTDFTLISVSEEGGNLALERVAVGDHILLGGDNMDLALAATMAQHFADEGRKLDAWQTRALVHSCRAAKETLLAATDTDAAPVTVLGRGRSVIGGTIRGELKRADVQALILDGFFPSVGATDLPQRKRRAGLQELGLPFAADAAITRHLAKFLADHAKSPTAILFNGGVMTSPPLRSRVVETLDSWSADPERDLQLLDGTDLDLAVAHGAAYYGLVRRGKGVRIRGGTARSYYVGIESSMPAVPGMAPPLKAICVAPMGMEEGTDAEIAGEEFGLAVGEPAEFRFLSSTVRADDKVGAVHEDLAGITETAPMEVALPPSPGIPAGQLVPVKLRAHVTSVGTLEVWCVARDGQKWKLEYDTRGDQR